MPRTAIEVEWAAKARHRREDRRAMIAAMLLCVGVGVMMGYAL